VTRDEVHLKLLRALEHAAEADGDENRLQVMDALVQPLALASIALELREIREALKPVSLPR
jgi:hypothetical protein